jgi:uncharacterized protein (DUF362 family)
MSRKDIKRRVSRRHFISLSAGLGVVAAAGAAYYLSQAAPRLTPTKTSPSPSPTLVSVYYDPTLLSYPSSDQFPYSKDRNPCYHAVESALSELYPDLENNPLSNIVKKGDTVAIKPNLLGAFPEGAICTHTSLLRPLLDLAANAGASRIVVCEGPAIGGENDEMFKEGFSNIANLVADLQKAYADTEISWLNLNKDSFTWLDLGSSSELQPIYSDKGLFSEGYESFRPGPGNLGKDDYYRFEDSSGHNPGGFRPGLYAIPNTILGSDVFINVPKIKTHCIAGVTLSLKNLIGITISDTGRGKKSNEDPLKNVPHFSTPPPHWGDNEKLSIEDSSDNDVLWRVVADLNKTVLYSDKHGTIRQEKQRSYLSVVDGIIGMEWNGPVNGIPKPMGVVAVGSDPVAVDAVCCRIMGYDYATLRIVKNLSDLTDHPIGTCDPSRICVVGESLDKVSFSSVFKPHDNYADSKIAPRSLTLPRFDPPNATSINVTPITDKGEMNVSATIDNPQEIRSAWVRFGEGSETRIVGMELAGAEVSCSIPILNDPVMLELVDRYLNAKWYDVEF